MPDRLRAVFLDGLGTLLALPSPGPALVTILRERYGVQLDVADAQAAFGAEIGYYRAHHHEAGTTKALEGLRRRCAEVLYEELPSAAAGALTVAQLQTAMLAALRFDVYPDVLPTLRALRARGLRLVVVSNWDISLSGVLAGVGVVELLDGVVTSAEVGACKPEPTIFAAALELAGVPPRAVLHVGDSLAQDVAGARDAGIAAVLLRRGNTPSGEAGASGGATPPPGVAVIGTLSDLMGMNVVVGSRASPAG